MARWRTRRFTVVATLGLRWVELGTLKRRSFRGCCSFMCCLEVPHERSNRAATIQTVRGTLGGRFGYFLFFSPSGEGKGESGGDREAGGRFFIENPRRGGCLPGRVRGPGGCLQGFWEGGGLNIFLGAETSTKN